VWRAAVDARGAGTPAHRGNGAAPSAVADPAVHGRGISRAQPISVFLRLRRRACRRGARRPPQRVRAFLRRHRRAREDARPERPADFRARAARLGRPDSRRSRASRGSLCGAPRRPSRRADAPPARGTGARPFAPGPSRRGLVAAGGRIDAHPRREPPRPGRRHRRVAARRYARRDRAVRRIAPGGPAVVLGLVHRAPARPARRGVSARSHGGATTMSEEHGFPPQKQPRQPGDEHRMHPETEIIRPGYIGSKRLEQKHCLITGGDSGIGRAVAVHFAAESAASVAIVYREEREDAEKTRTLVEERGTRCLLIEGDVEDPGFPRRSVDEAAAAAGGRIDVLVNNAAVQWPQSSIEDITLEQIERTFRTNIYAYFLYTQAV